MKTEPTTTFQIGEVSAVFSSIMTLSSKKSCVFNPQRNSMAVPTCRLRFPRAPRLTANSCREVHGSTILTYIETILQSHTDLATDM